MFSKTINLGLVGLMAAAVASFYLLPSFSQAKEEEDKRLEARREQAWVDSLYQSMTEDQRLGQLLMLAAYPYAGQADEQKVSLAIRDYHIGGIIFFQGQPHQLARLTNLYQAQSKYPLLCAIDGEWGLNMRIDSTVAYPRQLLLGAIQDNRWVYEFGKQVAKECKRVGIHLNFAPVVDINSNAANPVIGDRSFGEDRDNVVNKAFHYMKGMQDNGVMACAKHFPGHGDTQADSHYDLPKIQHQAQRLDSLELYPFRALIRQGIGSIMVGHLEVPAVDSTPNLPTTLSHRAIQTLLKDSMGYEGLVLTDALNMKGVTKHFAHGDIDVRALIAGNDILLMPQDLPAAKAKIKKAIQDGRLQWTDLEQRVRKILRLKYRYGLAKYQPVDTRNVTADLNSPEALALQAQLVGQALTLVSHSKGLLPLDPRKIKMATLSLNSSQKTIFQQELEQLGVKDHFFAPHNLPPAQTRRLAALEKYDVVVVSLRYLSRSPLDNYNLSTSAIQYVNQLSKKTKVVVTCFGSPYALKFFDTMPNLVVAYNEEAITQRIAAQALLGLQPFLGKLPVSASPNLRAGRGDSLLPQSLAYSVRPEEVGLNSKILDKIDGLADEMIKEKAAPGCQVLVVRQGKVAFHRTYGHHLYDRRRPVAKDDIYDLASVTKIAATTLAVMKLYEEGKLDLTQTLGHYLPELKGTNKEHLIIQEVMAHQAGLKAWIPFYKQTLDERKRPQTQYYRRQPDNEYCIRVSEGMYMCRRDVDSLVWQRVYESELLPEKSYVYSDLGMILMAKVVESLVGSSLDEYVKKHFYQPMSLSEIGFNPIQMGLNKARIVPTEQDDYFRYQLVHGDVHDMAAAMLGGIAGHAGLFARAQDLGTVLAMLANYGEFQGRRYLKKETIQQFIAPFSSKEPRRGLGFDRKDKKADGSASNVPNEASDLVFGHLGFTGIAAWVDPKEDLVFIFLSNRTYPSGENMKLVKKDTRRRMHSLVYQAIFK